MKKYLLKISVFAFCIFMLGVVITALFPFHNYAYPLLNMKIMEMEKRNYNTVFIGSSKINNQINCLIIDSLIPGSRSYNLGANAGFALENFNTVERILENPHLPIEKIILEFNDKIDINSVNFNTERSYGVFNFQNYLFDMQYQWEQSAWKQLGYIQISYILNNLHFNKANTLPNNPSAIEKKVVEENQGFYPLNWDSNPKVKERHQALLKDTLIIARRELGYYQYHPKTPSQVVIDKLQTLQEQCNAKNIQLYLLIPSPAEANAKDLLAYIPRLKIPVIECLDPKTNPEFYEVKNRWDYGHLNENGANIFSRKIASQLNDL